MEYSKLIKVVDGLKALGSSFNDLQNHSVVLAAQEVGPTVLNKVLAALLEAEDSISQSISYLEDMVAESSSNLESADLEEVAALAGEFDKNDDEWSKKQASVLDQLLINFSRKSHGELSKKADEDEITRLRAKLRSEKIDELYKGPKEAHDERNHASEAAQAISDSIKQYRPLEAPLSTRSCIDHPGQSLVRIADDTYQCSLDKKIYSYAEGFTTAKGNKVPGGSVAEQTAGVWDRGSIGMVNSMGFSTRESLKQ